MGPRWIVGGWIVGGVGPDGESVLAGEVGAGFGVWSGMVVDFRSGVSADIEMLRYLVGD